MEDASFANLLRSNLNRLFVASLSDVCTEDGALDMNLLKGKKRKALLNVHTDKTATPEYTIDEVKEAFTWFEENAEVIKVRVNEADRLTEDYKKEIGVIRKEEREALRLCAAGPSQPLPARPIPRGSKGPAQAAVAKVAAKAAQVSEVAEGPAGGTRSQKKNDVTPQRDGSTALSSASAPARPAKKPRPLPCPPAPPLVTRSMARIQGGLIN